MADVDIVEFLTARYDEEQQLAEAAAAADPAPWTANASNERGASERAWEHGFGLVIAADGIGLWDCEGSSTLCMTASTTRHVAYWDPARVLADIAAKRAIVKAYAGARTRIAEVRRDGYHAFDAQRVQGAEEALTVAVLALAAPFVEHPDYDPAWTV
jgi:hypothetical protein